MKSYLTAALIVCLALLAGCQTVGPDFKPPKMALPDAYRFITDDAKSVDDLKWWELFGDPVLHTLVTAALENNRDLATAISRIEEARATYGFTRADEYPTINISAGGYHGNYSGARSTTTDSNLYISPTLSWELDFWGRYRRASAAARADIMASEFSARAVQIGLIADVASAYYQLLDFRQRLEISKVTLASRQKSLDIIQKRFARGTIPEIDVNQAQIQLEIAASAIPQYERLIAKTEHTLNLLSGRLPGSIQTSATLAEQSPPPFVPSFLPSALLERRPDIRHSLALLHASNEEIGVAVAQRFPAISLTGTLGLAHSDFSRMVVQGGVWNGNASLLGPLIDFKKSLRRVEVAKIQTRQALLDYESSVLKAFSEVEDALVEVDTYRRECGSANRKVAAAESAASLSFKRYDKGVSSFLELLDSERTLFSAKLEYSETKQCFFNAYVKLYKVLGGGWISPDDQPAASTDESQRDSSWFQ